MADKLIVDLQQRSNVSADVNFAVDDGTQSYRVTAAQIREFMNPNPIGSGMDYYGTTLPDGYLWADGSVISRSTFAALFAAIGTTFGVGDGSTSFALPDKRGRVSVAKDNLGGSAASRVTTAGSGLDGATLGAGGGAETHTLTTPQMPSHTHTQNAHNHTQDAHKHSLGGANGGGGSTTLITSGGQGIFQGSYGYNEVNGTMGNAQPAIQNATATNQNTGGGGAHNNVQPSLICNYIIKYR